GSWCSLRRSPARLRPPAWTTSYDRAPRAASQPAFRRQAEREVTAGRVTAQGNTGYAPSCRLVRQHRFFAPDERASQPPPEHQGPDDHGRVAVDEPPDEDVRGERGGLHVDLHYGGREQLSEPR